MPEPLKTVLPIALIIIAAGVIIVGLAGGESGSPTDAERVDSIAAQIKCPFCSGESLADSTSGVAGDYRAIIETRVEEGATDAEILDEFAASFGDSYILDPNRSAWSVLLWAVPIALLIGGVFAIFSLRRASMEAS